jgi:hypothetical protein
MPTWAGNGHPRCSTSTNFRCRLQSIFQEAEVGNKSLRIGKRTSSIDHSTPAYKSIISASFSSITNHTTSHEYSLSPSLGNANVLSPKFTQFKTRVFVK